MANNPVKRTAFHSIAVPLGIVVTFILPTPPASAECVRTTARQVMESKHYEVVFSGTVVAITRTADFGYRATFDVDRVWKGTVAKRSDLHVWEMAAETPRFVVGQKYLALARKLVAPEERNGVGLKGTDIVAFTPVQCSDPDSLAPDIIRDLGRGYPPKGSDGIAPGPLAQRHPPQFGGVPRIGVEVLDQG
jgi:hypothetical protein